MRAPQRVSSLSIHFGTPWHGHERPWKDGRICGGALSPVRHGQSSRDVELQLGRAVYVDTSNLSFRPDFTVVSFIAPLAAFLVFFIWKLSTAISAKTSRLRAAVRLSAVQRRSSAPADEGDPRVIRELRIAKEELSVRQAEETEARSIRPFPGGPVVLRLEVPDTVDTAMLEDELSGVAPRDYGGISPLQNLGYAVQLLFLVPALALLMTDPIGQRDFSP